MKKRKFITAVLSVVLGCSASAAVAKPSAQEILAASDAIRNPDHPFGLTTTLTEYRDGKQTDVSTLAVYSRADKESGQFRSLIHFIAPARDANKLMLKTGNDLWFYDPSNKASIRISPQQRLLGQAANGDVVTFNLAKDYSATLSGEEEVLDADRQKRNSYKLTLAATKPDVTYHHIETWIDSANNRPVKTAYYRQYENQLGAERPTETVIIDGLDPKWVTVLRFTNWAVRDMPEAWLQRDYLPRFKPQ
jgi:outer membrane lipoprotein-sorting protein